MAVLQNGPNLAGEKTNPFWMLYPQRGGDDVAVLFLLFIGPSSPLVRICCGSRLHASMRGIEIGVGGVVKYDLSY
jgi:hypothetical protein